MPSTESSFYTTRQGSVKWLVFDHCEQHLEVCSEVSICPSLRPASHLGCFSCMIKTLTDITGSCLTSFFHISHVCAHRHHGPLSFHVMSSGLDFCRATCLVHVLHSCQQIRMWFQRKSVWTSWYHFHVGVVLDYELIFLCQTYDNKGLHAAFWCQFKLPWSPGKVTGA